MESFYRLIAAMSIMAPTTDRPVFSKKFLRLGRIWR
jgi:hypothetical protein